MTSKLSQWEKRVIVFKFIYSLLICDLNKEEELIKVKTELPNDEYLFSIIVDYIENKDKYNQLLAEHLLKTWKIERVDYIDRAIIYSAIAESNIHKIDKSIIIDQAIITAKKYGETNSYKFVNFILDKVIK